MLISILNAMFLLAFLLSAAVQYNDPDALVWAAIYLAAVAMCILQFRPHPPRWLAPALVVISVMWILTLLPSVVGKVPLADIFASLRMQTRAVEEAREIGGLCLVGLWAAVLTVRQRRQRS
jgi:hypothetical protein